jgi:hypothetical protein
VCVCVRVRACEAYWLLQEGYQGKVPLLLETESLYF